MKHTKTLLGLLLSATGMAAAGACLWQSGHDAGQASAHLPPYVKRGFLRADAIAIAQREWRLFGSEVHDEKPDPAAPPPTDKKERSPGHWQRVGDYFWYGLDMKSLGHAYTGRHNEKGEEFPAASDETYAWSGAFISYVMRMAGAGERFPVSFRHSDYINTGRSIALNRQSGGLRTESLESGLPEAGDLLCYLRDNPTLPRFEDLPTAYNFPSHCDIVVTRSTDELTVIGGNVRDSVSLKHIPLDGGHIADGRYRWFAIVKPRYDAAP
jgi:hypothetical protein